MRKRFLAFVLILGLVLSGCGAGASSTDGALTSTSGDSTSAASSSAGTGDNSEKPVGLLYTATMPTGPEESSIYVEPVEGISDDFYRGVDISTILVEEAAGAKYYNEAGEEEDVFKILADAGVNYVRVRVWNDPYDENGNGYGGGNCDVNTAAEIGRREANYGMKLLVDFHYSDFWADPSKQMTPKAWEGMTAVEKADAAYTFTLESLKTIIDAGADVGMVQIGNEINNGMSGETAWLGKTKILSKASQAVRETASNYGTDIKVAVHFTNPENYDGMYTCAKNLKIYEVDYDVFCTSYYPYWHGTLTALSKILTSIKKDFGKDVMVAETSYMFTTDDGDGNANSVGEKDICDEYAASPQGQANSVRDICATVSDLGGLGVFYWEPAWIPVTADTWETLGTGWASSYAAGYDPDDAGKYYGGCAWDNQAMFDFTGKALPSLSVWKYLKYGTICEAKIESVTDATVDLITGDELVMPETVDVYYNNSTLNGPATVTWDETEIAAVDNNAPGEYVVHGTLEDGTATKCTVKVAGQNLIENASFEDSDRSAWTIGSCVDYQQKESDAYSGEWAMHYWSGSKVSFTAETTLTGLEDGKYTFSLYTQGGDAGTNPTMYIYATSGGVTTTQNFSVNGWIDWQHPVIASFEVKDGTATVGISVDASAGAWGTFDDVFLSKIE